jgi:hypothetical protein
MFHLARQIGYHISDFLASRHGSGRICESVCKTRKRNAIPHLVGTAVCHAFVALVAAEGAIRCNKGGLTPKLRSVGAWLLWLIPLALHIAFDPVANRVFR